MNGHSTLPIDVSEIKGMGELKVPVDVGHVQVRGLAVQIEQRLPIQKTEDGHETVRHPNNYQQASQLVLEVAKGLEKVNFKYQERLDRNKKVFKQFQGLLEIPDNDPMLAELIEVCFVNLVNSPSGELAGVHYESKLVAETAKFDIPPSVASQFDTHELLSVVLCKDAFKQVNSTEQKLNILLGLMTADNLYTIFYANLILHKISREVQEEVDKSTDILKVIQENPEEYQKIFDLVARFLKFIIIAASLDAAIIAKKFPLFKDDLKIIIKEAFQRVVMAPKKAQTAAKALLPLSENTANALQPQKLTYVPRTAALDGKLASTPTGQVRGLLSPTLNPVGLFGQRSPADSANGTGRVAPPSRLGSTSSRLRGRGTPGAKMVALSPAPYSPALMSLPSSPFQGLLDEVSVEGVGVHLLPTNKSGSGR